MSEPALLAELPTPYVHCTHSSAVFVCRTSSASRTVISATHIIVCLTIAVSLHLQLAVEIIKIGKDAVSGTELAVQESTARAVERLRRRWDNLGQLRSSGSTRLTLEDIPRGAELVKNPFGK